MKKALLATLAAVAAVLACGAPEPGPDAAAAPEARDKIVIGHPAALSGRYAEAAEQAVGGIKAAVEWINSSYGGVEVGGVKLPLEYTFYDCQSREESVTSLLERLINTDKVDFTFAPYSSGLTLAGAAVSEKYGVLYMDHGGASDKIFEQGFEYVVQTIGPGSKYHAGTLDLVQTVDPDAKRLALAYEDSEFARSVMDGTKAYAESLGFEIVFERTYPMGVTDLTPLLSDLGSVEPDIVLGGGHFEDGLLFSRQMADLAINPGLVSLIAAATLPAFAEELGELAEGVMGPSHWEYGVTFSAEGAAAEGYDWIGPSQEEFVTLFKKAAGEVTPDYHAAEAAAAVLALVKGIESADSVETDAVRQALNDLTFMSFYGGWDIDTTGKQVGHSMVDVQWQSGERMIVWPEAAKTSDVVYPKPAFDRGLPG